MKKVGCLDGTSCVAPDLQVENATRDDEFVRSAPRVGWHALSRKVVGLGMVQTVQYICRIRAVRDRVRKREGRGGGACASRPRIRATSNGMCCAHIMEGKYQCSTGNTPARDMRRRIVMPCHITSRYSAFASENAADSNTDDGRGEPEPHVGGSRSPTSPFLLA